MSGTIFRAPDKPVLSPDFAAKVLVLADAKIATRRRRNVALVVIAVAAAAIAGGIVLRPAPAPETARAAPPRAVAHLEPGLGASTANKAEARALTTFFPDATSLVQFDQSYSAAMTGIGVEQGNDGQDAWL